jgi:hypothetical protein
MISNNPIVSEGQTYDKLSVNLAVTSSYTKDGERDLSIALRVIPTRVDSEIGGITLDSQAYTVYRGRLSELQGQDEQNCVGQMIVALQQFINSRRW